MVINNWRLPKYTKHEFKKKSSKYCVCIPVLNEGKKIQDQLSKMQTLSNKYDVIIADGNSSDNSTSQTFLKKVGIRTLLVKKSPGKQATQLRMAFAYALNEGYEGIIQVDGNNKDGIEAIPEFAKKLQQGYDYVQGSRFIEGGKGINTPLKRYLGVRLIASPILSMAGGFWYTDVTNGFRGYSKKYLLNSKVAPFRNCFVNYSLNFYLTVRANQLGIKTIELPVKREYPRGLIPTKMNGVKGELKLFEEVIKTFLGYYHQY